MGHEVVGQFQLNTQVVSHMDLSRHSEQKASYIDSILVRLNNRPEHLPRLDTIFIDKATTDIHQRRERELDNLVELGPQIPRLESVHAADRKQALEPRKNRIRIVGVQQRDRDVHVIRPFLGKVILQDLREDGDQLRSDLGSRRREERDQATSQMEFLVVGNWFVRRVVVLWRPSPDDSVLQVNDRYKQARTLLVRLGPRSNKEAI